MRRRLFALASAVSLLLCLASVVQWVRSRTSDCGFDLEAYKDGALTDDWKATSETYLWLTYEHRREEFDRKGTAKHYKLSWSSARHIESPSARWNEEPTSVWGRLGFAYERTANDRYVGWFVHLPFWAAVVPTSVLPVLLAFVVIRRTRRGLAGLCPTCGYSLTGNTSGVCPECGTPVPKEPAEKSPRPA